MFTRTDFPVDIFASFLAGQTALDLKRHLFTDERLAEDFLRSYGYDLGIEEDRLRLWSLHRRAVTYLETQLLKSTEQIPQELKDETQLQSLRRLLTMAQDPSRPDRQRYACAIVRVMHVLAHLSNELFTSFSEEIQSQIFACYDSAVKVDPAGTLALYLPDGERCLELFQFDKKPFKTSNSAITKLLAKPEEVAFGLMDRLGVRFVTHTVFDCFRVLAFLVRSHVVSYPHLIPEQSNNTLYPLNLFSEVLKESSDAELEDSELMSQKLARKLELSQDRAAYREKLNVFTSRDYRFMKFIVRKLIRVQQPVADRALSFFYPYEVQIVDQKTFLRNSEGPSSHAEYKARQKARARLRVMGPD